MFNQTLIFGTMYMSNQYHVELVRLWLNMVKSKYPDAFWILIDSRSNIDLFNQLQISRVAAERRIDQLNICHTFHDNIGHLSGMHPRNKDGWGRAFCYGVEFGIRNGFENIVHIESDVLTRIDINKVISNLDRTGKGVACPKVNLPGVQGWIIETGLMIMKTSFVKRIDLIGKYDWKNSQVPDAEKGIDNPEQRLTKIIGDRCWGLDVPGGRDEGLLLGDCGTDIRKAYDRIKTYGYLTHAAIEHMQIFANL